MSANRNDAGAAVVGSVENDEVLLGWTVHLARRQPRKLIGIAAVTFFAAAFGYLILQSVIPVAATLLALLWSVSDFLFPVSYKLTKKGVEARYAFGLSRMEWRSVRRVYADTDGVKLSPFAKPSRLDSFRGVYLRCDRNEATVLDIIGKFHGSADD